MSAAAAEGYAMAALLVALSVMAVMTSVALPAWSHAVRREKEAELIFRGEQYRRAIALFQRRFGPGTLPPDLETLVDNRVLRRIYADPITGGEFVLIRQGQAPGGATAPGTAVGGIIGVVSASRAESIRLYNDRRHYHEWQFIHLTAADRPGTGGQQDDSLAPGGSRDAPGADSAPEPSPQAPDPATR